MEHDPELYEKYRSLREYIASLSCEEFDKIREDFEDIGLGNATFDDMDTTSMQERRRIRRKAGREKRRRKSMLCDDLSDAEIEYICGINSRLIDVHQWHVARTNAVIAFHNEKVGESPSDQFDYGTSAFFRFSLESDAPDFDPAHEYNNRLAVFEEYSLSLSGLSEETWNWHNPMIRGFKDVRFCYLFHQLQHELDCEWDDLLRVGEIWVEHVHAEQLFLYWNDNPLPERCGSREVPSVFHGEICTNPLDHHCPEKEDEFLYAQLLNRKMREAEQWLHATAREMERAYLDSWRHLLPPDSPDIHEDYVLCARIQPLLSERHHEYKQDEDNMLADLQQIIPQSGEFIFGSPRHPLQDEGFWKMYEEDVYKRYWEHCGGYSQPAPDEKEWRFCKLFHDIHDSLNNDWNRTLCIGGLWVDVILKQRRFISLRGNAQ